MSPDLITKLDACRHQIGPLVALLDPDHAGRALRGELERRYPGNVLHAFVPAPAARLKSNKGNKEVGDIGVQHASSDALVDALKKRRTADATRRELSKENLLAWGLGGTRGTQPKRGRSSTEQIA